MVDRSVMELSRSFSRVDRLINGIPVRMDYGELKFFARWAKEIGIVY